MVAFKVDDRDYALWLLLTRTHYRVKRARTRELTQYGLTPEQAGTLYFIKLNGNYVMPIEVSRWMHREPQTITSIIDRMVNKGFIKKSHDRDRKNVVRLSLTEKGEATYTNTIKRESFHKILSVLTESQRQSLQTILTDIFNAAKSEPKTETDPEDELF